MSNKVTDDFIEEARKSLQEENDFLTDEDVKTKIWANWCMEKYKGSSHESVLKGALDECIKLTRQSQKQIDKKEFAEAFWDWIEDLPLKNMPLTDKGELQLTDVHEVSLEEFHKFANRIKQLGGKTYAK
jgi:hypothetical protein